MFFVDVQTLDAPAPVYSQAVTEAPDLVLQIGDLDHSDPSNEAEARALNYRMRDVSMQHGNDFVSNVISKFSLLHIRDDHDYCGQ